MAKRQSNFEYQAVFERCDDGGYSVYVPDLPGCVSCGDTIEEARSMIREAIEIYMDELQRRGKTPPQPQTRAQLVQAELVAQ